MNRILVGVGIAAMIVSALFGAQANLAMKLTGSQFILYSLIFVLGAIVVYIAPSFSDKETKEAKP